VLQKFSLASRIELLSNIIALWTAFFLRLYRVFSADTAGSGGDRPLGIA